MLMSAALKPSEFIACRVGPRRRSKCVEMSFRSLKTGKKQLRCQSFTTYMLDIYLDHWMQFSYTTYIYIDYRDHIISYHIYKTIYT